jgi:hypothetical protein
MKKKRPPIMLLAALLAVGGAFLIGNFRPEPPEVRREFEKLPPVSANLPAPERREASPVQADIVPVVTRASVHGPILPRHAGEVFAGGEQPALSWHQRHPATVRVAPSPGIFLTFHQVQVRTEGRHFTWVGRNAELPGATFVGVATVDGYDAVMMLPGVGQYNFHVRGQRVLVEEFVAAGRDCELGSVGVSAPQPLAVPPAVRYAEAGETTGANPRMLESAGAVEGLPRVDVLFLYNTRALAVAAERSPDPVGYIDGYARAGLETCNQVLVNSRIDNFSWRYVGLVAAPEYPEKQTVSEDLAMIGPNGPFAAFVSAVRAEYGADQVLMWVGAGTRQGSAYTGETRGEAVPVEYAVAGLRLTAGILILAHELAHNFGCHHDRGHAGTGDGSTATPNGDGRWCYGLLWDDPGGLGTTSGTVMAYADFLVPYFSNPEIVLNITSTLENRPGPFRDLGTRAIGFPESDPRAADNARVMREHGAYMAALNEETEAMPVILQQPRDAALQTGQTMLLSVSAVGGSLGYQWLKDGAEIPGATEAVLSRTFAATDAGNYSVRVANRRGTVSSRTAAVILGVTVSPPVVPPPAPAAPSPAVGGGGGGGGGAPSVWFFLVMSVLVLVRIKRSSVRMPG